MEKNNVLASMEKALDILLMFNPGQQELSATEISERLGLPLSTTYKYLKALRNKDFIAKDDSSKRFHLGWTIFSINSQVSADHGISDVAFTEMKELVTAVGETALLTVVSGDKSMCLERVESSRLVKISHERGSIRPLHAGASGKILLAYQEADFLSDYFNRKRLQDHYLNEDAICSQLEDIRRQGYAFSDSELDIDAVAVAAPVFNHTSRLVAGLTVAGPKDRTNMNKLGVWTEAVRAGAQRMSRRLGCPEDILIPNSHSHGAV